MVVRAPKGQEKDQPTEELARIPTEVVREHAAKLYGRGFYRAQIARALQPHLSPSNSLAAAKTRLVKWEQQQEFRDLIWKHAVVKTDLEAPKIMEGIVGAAKRGRVDAAKLALGIAGRYTDRSDMPTEVTLRLEGFNRPNDRQEPSPPNSQLHGRAALPPGIGPNDRQRPS